MDVGLGHAWQVAKEFADMAVLILVLVDVGLGLAPGSSTPVDVRQKS